MSVNEIQRVKQDIDTIKEAAGLELPFGWDSVWAHLIGVPCIGVCCLVYCLLSDSPSRYALAVPAALVLLLLGYLRFKYRRSTGRSATERREYGSQFYMTVFLVVFAGGFLTWAKLAGVDIVYIVYVASGLATMLGIMITFNGFSRRVYRSALGGGIPCILYGISIAVWPSPSAVLINATILLFVAGPAMAFIEMYQLKHSGTEK